MLTYKSTLKNWWYTAGGCLPTGFEEGIAEAFNNAFEDARFGAREKASLLFGVVNKNEVYVDMYEIDMCISFYILKNSLQSTISWTMAGMINNQQKHIYIHVYIYNIYII